MNTMLDVYQKLKNDNPDSSFLYNEYYKQIEFHHNEYLVCALEQDSNAVINIKNNGKEYIYEIKSFADTFNFLNWLSLGKMNIEKVSNIDINITHWDKLKEENRNKRISAPKRVIGTVLGVLIALFFLSGIVAWSTFIDENSDGFDYSVFLVFGTAVFYGISLIKHVNSKNPIRLGKAVEYFIGVYLTMFSIAMSMVFICDWIKEYEFVDIVLLIIFLLFLAIGIDVVVMSLKKTEPEDYPFYITRKLNLPPKEQLEELINRINEKTAKETIEICYDTQRNPTIFDSKIGGVPYWDMSLSYPKAEEDLVMVGQINFSQLPENNAFPKQGILQLFIANDGSFGDDDTDIDGISHIGHKLVYHKDIDYSVTEESVKSLGIKTTLDEEFHNNDNFPVFGEFAIDFEKKIQSIPDCDYNATKIMYETANELGIELEDDINYFEICDQLGMYEGYDDIDMSQMLGYAHFLESDPRANLSSDDKEKYDTLLLKITSFYDNSSAKRGSINIGFYGSSLLYINKEKLAEGDFSDILYIVDSY